jgi:hypothetical protein
MGKILEQILPFLLAFTVSYFLWKYNIVNYKNSIELIKQFPIIGTCAFGFLLTMFSLIIQGNNAAIDRMRKRVKPFSVFVNFNKRVVIISFIATLYSYFIGYFKFDISCNNIEFLVFMFYGLVIWFIIEVFYFLIIFYILVQSEIKNTK